MSMIGEELALDEFERRWRAQGYTLIREPMPDQVPDFLNDFRPDGIAIGAKPNLVIEVVNPRSRYTPEKIQRLQSLFEGQDDWRLEVLYAPRDWPFIDKVGAEAVRRSIESASRLAETEPQAAFLLAFTALESVVRNRALQAGRRQPDHVRLQLGWLLEEGVFSQDEHMQLLSLSQLRNRLAHGQLDIVPTSEQIRKVIESVQRLDFESSIEQ